MENLKVEVKEGVSELVIREGEAKKYLPLKSINIAGTISAPYEFLSGKVGVMSSDFTHLQIRKDIGQLTLVMGDSGPETTHIIQGKLTRDSVLETFGINTDKRYTIQSFLKFVKMMRYYFEDKNIHSELVKSLQTWSIKIDRVIVDHNDQKGNSHFSLETKIQQVEGLISKFSLRLPIYQGFPKRTFSVEIGLDPRATAVDLFLISDDLIELEIGERESIIESELSKFDKFTFSKITIS